MYLAFFTLWGNAQRLRATAVYGSPAWATAQTISDIADRLLIALEPHRD